MSGEDDTRFQLPPDPEAAAEHWRAVPRERPAQTAPVGPGQESVWDYPRPPRLEAVERVVEVSWQGERVARSRRPLRVCETAGPPVYYVPLAEVVRGALRPARRESLCEWKGVARYWHVEITGARAPFAAFGYPEPAPGYEALADHVAFYPGRVVCLLDGERVRAQPGEFYGGWVTHAIVGPFKGVPGSERW